VILAICICNQSDGSSDVTRISAAKLIGLEWGIRFSEDAFDRDGIKQDPPPRRLQHLLVDRKIAAQFESTPDL
tara:strand:- start:68 stop:286 length:219 start_codon:yes stop_codon:yes gene_type:complete